MNISLRDYDQQIEELVDNSQIEEAVAHCRHILKEFPRHIDTRRLLAGAYLDARKYALAKDTFLGVLSSLPADFVANLGMSFIYSLEGDVHSAIWHMERAFEKSPNNIGIQDELKKLYTTRDGKTPDRLNKTDGVLAYLYFNSGEYARSEQTILDILKTDDTRREMKTLLAKVYYQQGKLELAAKTCQECFATSPDNFEANRLMIKILQNANDQQNLGQFRQRLQELDPYAIHPDTFLLADELFVPDDAIKIGHLEWSPQPVPADPEPNLDAELAINIPQPLHDEAATAPIETAPLPEVPAWLNDLMHPVQPKESMLNRTMIDEVPDWVKEIEPDPEPVYEHILPEDDLPPNFLEDTISRENELASEHRSVIDPWSNYSSNTSFGKQNLTITEDILNDPAIEQAVANVLKDLPSDEELELLAETRPLSGFTSTSQTQPVDPISSFSEENPPYNSEPLPNYVELDWLGDLGKHQPEATVEQARNDQPSQTAVTPNEETVNSESAVETEAAFTNPPYEQFVPIWDEPEAAEPPAPAHPLAGLGLPDMPNAALLDHIVFGDVPKPIPNEPNEPIEEIIPEDQPFSANQYDASIPQVSSEVIFGASAGSDPNAVENPAFEQLSQIDAPWMPLQQNDPDTASVFEPIEEIVPETAPTTYTPPSIGPWIPADQAAFDPEAEPKILTKPGKKYEVEILDDPSVLFAEENIDAETTEETDLSTQAEPAESITPEAVSPEPIVETAEETDLSSEEEPVESEQTVENEPEILDEPVYGDLYDDPSQDLPFEDTEGEAIQEEDEEADDLGLPTSDGSEPELPAATEPNRLNPSDAKAELELEFEPELERDEPDQPEPDLSKLVELAPALQLLANGDLSAALDEFIELIRQETHLPEVIYQLEKIVLADPMNKKAWRCLGDAHFNSNHVEEALTAYTKADSLMDGE